MKFDAKRGKLVQLMQSSWHEVTSWFFAMNTPNPPHWTLNSCFRKFHSVWVHLLWFRNCMKLSAKRCELVQLMQKFMPRSHVRIFLPRMHPIYSIGPYTHVFLCFIVFGRIC